MQINSLEQKIIQNYQIHKQIGKGEYGKVYLGQNLTSQKFYAIKMIKTEDIQKPERLLNEIQAMLNVFSPYTIRIINYFENQSFLNSKKQTIKVFILIEELAKNGEIFDYLIHTNNFGDEVSRYYFQQLIQGIEHIAQAGLAHRDIKPENLLLDDNYNLKICDFGLSQSLIGINTDNKLHSYVGTSKYMAPEMVNSKGYNGTCVDIFAAGIVLFRLVVNEFPFCIANSKDQRYKLIIENKFKEFWKYFSKKNFDSDFQDLFIKMVNFIPEKRITIQEIKNHPWYNKNVPSNLQIIAQFQQIQRVVREKQLKIQQQSQTYRENEQNLQNQMQNVAKSESLEKLYIGTKPFRNVTISEQKQNIGQVEQQRQTYYIDQNIFNVMDKEKFILINEQQNPLTLYNCIRESCQEINSQILKIIESKTKFKLTITIRGVESNHEIQFKLFQIDCIFAIEVQKIDGEYFEHKQIIKELKEKILYKFK